MGKIKGWSSNHYIESNTWYHDSKRNPQNGKRYFVGLVQDREHGWLVVVSKGEGTKIFTHKRTYAEAKARAINYMRSHPSG